MTYWEKANHSWTADSTRFALTPKQKVAIYFITIQEIGYFKAKAVFLPNEESSPFLFDEIYPCLVLGRLHYQDEVHNSKSGDIFFIDCKNYQYYKTISSEPLGDGLGSLFWWKY